MKVKSAIRAICKHCYVVRRGKTRFVYCKKNPRHKQRQGFHTHVCSQQCCESIVGLENDLMQLSLSKPVSLETVLPMIVNPLDGNTVAVAGSKKPIKYHPELGISSIYWNIQSYNLDNLSEAVEALMKHEAQPIRCMRLKLSELTMLPTAVIAQPPCNLNFDRLKTPTTLCSSNQN